LWLQARRYAQSLMPSTPLVIDIALFLDSSYALNGVSYAPPTVE